MILLLFTLILNLTGVAFGVSFSTGTTCPTCTIKNGKLKCAAAGSNGQDCGSDNICSIVLRSHGKGKRVESVCKDPQTCINEQRQNANGQCRPKSTSGSVCRQCCRGNCGQKMKALKTKWHKAKNWDLIMYVDFE